jgi:DNA-binding transcriptional ArsR family regulator
LKKLRAENHVATLKSLRALSDPTRLRIVALLERTNCP